MFDDLGNSNQNSTAPNSGVIPNSVVKPEVGKQGEKKESNIENKSDFADSQKDLNKVNSKNKPESADDMFAEIEPKPKPPAFEKKQEDLNGDKHRDKDGKNHQKIFFLTFVVLMLIFLSICGIWAYNYFMKKINDRPVADENANITEFEEIKNSADDVKKDVLEIEKKEEKAEVPEVLDSDGDGLTDEEEWSLGTAIDNVDTDSDGLFDREEVRVYKTDPKNPDTDGDGYIDGDEVNGGYNPLGSGRLFDVKK